MEHPVRGENFIHGDWAPREEPIPSCTARDSTLPVPKEYEEGDSATFKPAEVSRYHRFIHRLWCITSMTAFRIPNPAPAKTPQTLLELELPGQTDWSISEMKGFASGFYRPARLKTSEKRALFPIAIEGWTSLVTAGA